MSTMKARWEHNGKVSDFYRDDVWCGSVRPTGHSRWNACWTFPSESSHPMNEKTFDTYREAVVWVVLMAEPYEPIAPPADPGNPIEAMGFILSILVALGLVVAFLAGWCSDESLGWMCLGTAYGYCLCLGRRWIHGRQ